jgi:hypothetical protein
MEQDEVLRHKGRGKNKLPIQHLIFRSPLSDLQLQLPQNSPTILAALQFLIEQIQPEFER